jgi:hypothetical protein
MKTNSMIVLHGILLLELSSAMALPLTTGSNITEIIRTKMTNTNCQDFKLLNINMEFDFKWEGAFGTSVLAQEIAFLELSMSRDLISLK